MLRQKIISSVLSAVLLLSMISAVSAATIAEKTTRTVYIHAQGENPKETTNVTTVSKGDQVDVYLAVNDPNMGEYSTTVDDDGNVIETHIEPQYDMNGVTVRFYYDPYFFELINPENTPIEYAIHDGRQVSDMIIENGQNVPNTIGYYVYKHDSEKVYIPDRGKTYNSAYIHVFVSGTYYPLKGDDELWYNIVKLPLRAINSGNTEVFIENESADEFSLELYAKNVNNNYAPNFPASVINSGIHQIIIKDKYRPAPPVADPYSGSYSEPVSVTLTADDGCDIMWSKDGVSFTEYTEPIDVQLTTEIYCYATNGEKQSNTVSYKYTILPKPPYLFDENVKRIPNIYDGYGKYNVFVSASENFENIPADTEIYYTFNAKADESNPQIGDNHETEWVKIEKGNPVITIDKPRTVKLIASKLGEYSEATYYYLGVKPEPVKANYESGSYKGKLDIKLSTNTDGAVIYYTTDGTDPRQSKNVYTQGFTIYQNTTVRAVAKYGDVYSDVTSYFYRFEAGSGYEIDAFYPSGTYEGEVKVTLTPYNPDNKVVVWNESKGEWEPYTGVITVDKSQTIKVKCEEAPDDYIYELVYVIQPLPPIFAPESTSFANSEKITIYAPESGVEIYYTTDGSDPTTNPDALKTTNLSATVDIYKYTVVSAATKKDGLFSRVETHSYDVIKNKPVRPYTTLLPGYYTIGIDDEKGYTTQFMPVPDGTKIYYNISYGDEIKEDPTTLDILYNEGDEIPLKGNCTIKAVAINAMGVKSDIGIFKYVIAPEAPTAVPSDTYGDKLPVVPVKAVVGSDVTYTIGDFTNTVKDCDGEFYIDLNTGNAYEDADCTQPLGNTNTKPVTEPVVLELSAELDKVKSPENVYAYTTGASATLAAPYADKKSGVYKEIDDNGAWLTVTLNNLNNRGDIYYTIDNSTVWEKYTQPLKLTKDTVIRAKVTDGTNESNTVSYVYTFEPLAPIIVRPSGVYTKSETEVITTEIILDSRAPASGNYTIMYRRNGDPIDFPYSTELEIDHTMSLKAYVVNNTTGKISDNAISYYIIDDNNSQSGMIYMDYPYNQYTRINVNLISQYPFSDGIKLGTDNGQAKINYYFEYEKTDGKRYTTGDTVYDPNNPIFVSSNMKNITITAWLTDLNGNVIDTSEKTFETIHFITVNVPETSLGTSKVEYPSGTKYTIDNKHPGDSSIYTFYTLDKSDPITSDTRKQYGGETLSIDKATTVKAVNFSVCGKCGYCKDGKKTACINGVYSEVGTYNYTVPTVITGGGGGGGGGGTVVVDKTRKYTVDIWKNEHSTHIGYIYGYPDGSVQPDGKITREEVTAILYRIDTSRLDDPFVVTGEVFPDVAKDRWSVQEIEYMAEHNVVYGYDDGEFKPARNLTRAEFAALIRRITGINKKGENIFTDLEKTHWAYEDILYLVGSGLVEGYEDKTFRPEREISRAEVMQVINKILGRTPSDRYVKSLSYNPFNDLLISKWYYTTVMEATITHKYYLDKDGIEEKWEDWHN